MHWIVAITKKEGIEQNQKTTQKPAVRKKDGSPTQCTGENDNVHR
jgi:hypothetical protein